MVRSGHKRRLLSVLAVALVVVMVPASSALAKAAPKYQLVVNDDFSSGSIIFVVETVPDVVDAGVYKVGLANNSVAPHVLVAVGGLDPNISEAGLIAVIDSVFAGSPPPAGSFEAGAVFSKSGQDHQKQFDLTTPGQYGYFCPIVGPNGIPHYKEGFVGLFEVVG